MNTPSEQERNDRAKVERRAKIAEFVDGLSRKDRRKLERKAKKLMT